MIKAMGLDKYKTEMLEVFVHQSQVLDVVPEQYKDTIIPILHDALLAFMDGLSEERLAERLAKLAQPSSAIAAGTAPERLEPSRD